MSLPRTSRKKKTIRKSPRPKKRLSPEEEINEGLTQLGSDLDQLADASQDLERAAGDIGGTIEELWSELDRIRKQACERFEELRQQKEQNKTARGRLGTLACCHKMVLAQKPGGLPHVMQNDAGQWLLHGCPFNACPWCGQLVTRA